MRLYLQRLMAILTLAAPLHLAGAQGGPDLFSYQIQFPAPPSTGAKAMDSLNVRRDIMIAAMACGSELDFARSFGVGGEDAAAFLVAKMAWVGAHRSAMTFVRVGPAACTFSRNVVLCDVYLAMYGGDCEYAAEPVAFRASVGRAAQR